MVDGQLTRRTLLRLAAGAAAAPSLGALVAACQGAAPTTAPPSGGTVSLALSAAPKVLNPPIHTFAVESTVISLLMPGLLRMNAAGALEPDLARRYDVDPTGMTYRFQLRPGLVWEDGAPLTSRDFLFTYQTYVDPRTRAAYLTGWDKIDRVETPDDTTIVVHMRETYAPFLSGIGTSSILPEHVLSGVTNMAEAPFNRSPVGSGPFKLTAWTATEIVLEANDRYWRGRPRLDRFVFKVVPDATTQVNQLQAGEVDIVRVPPELWNRVRTMSGVRGVHYHDTTYVLVQLDEYDFLREIPVRQALDLATPKQDIIGGVLRGLAAPATADVPPGSPYFNSQVRPRPYDPAGARKLLAQAGFAMRDGVMSRDGRPLEVPIYTISTSPTYVQVAQVLKERWSKIGVRTEVVTMEQSALFSDQGPQWNGRDAALVFGWGQGTDPYNYVNWSSQQIPNGQHDPGENTERYRNARIDELVVRGVQVASLDDRRRIYDEIQAILQREVPVLFLYWPDALYAVSTRVHGFQPNAFSGLFLDVHTWTRGA